MCWRGHGESYKGKHGCRECHRLAQLHHRGVLTVEKRPLYRLQLNVLNYYRKHYKRRIPYIKVAAELSDVSLNTVNCWICRRRQNNTSEEKARAFAAAIRIPFDELFKRVQ